MDSAKLNEWLQVVGLFGVIASLIFVGLQMKQTDAIAVSATYQERAIASREHNLSLAGNPYFLSGMAKLYSGRHDELVAQEAIVLEYDLGSQLVVRDNYFQQYEWGYITDSYWNRTYEELKCLFENPWYREALQGWQFRAEYQALLEEVKKAAVDDPTGCWDLDFQYPIAE